MTSMLESQLQEFCANPDLSSRAFNEFISRLNACDGTRTVELIINNYNPYELSFDKSFILEYNLMTDNYRELFTDSEVKLIFNDFNQRMCGELIFNSFKNFISEYYPERLI